MDPYATVGSLLAGAPRSASMQMFRTELDEEEDLPYHLPQRPLHTESLRRREPKGQSMIGLAESTVDDRPLPWVESARFQSISALVIFGNAIVIGLETDIESPIWQWVEEALLCFFVFELSARLCRHGCGFFTHEDDWVWNLLDFSIVASGVADTWVMPLIEVLKTKLHSKHAKHAHHVGVVFMLMRMLRLLRIVRLFRLVKIVRPLYQLAQGVLEALQGMFWVLVMLVMTVYAAAILCTRFIGHGMAIPKEIRDDEEVQKIRDMFSTVFQSMFSLFGTMTSWSLLKFVPLFNPMPILQPLFVLFYIYSAWALLAIMTGVVSENLIAIREQMREQDEKKEQKRKQNITDLLYDLFKKVDEDQSGSISRAEFNSMLKDPQLMKFLITKSNLKLQDLHDLFDWLDHDGGGTITIDEFMLGFKWVNDPLTAKSIVKLQERLTSDLNVVRDTTMELTDQRFQQVMDVVSHPIRKVHAISEQMDNLDEMCGTLKVVLKADIENLPTLRDLNSIELGLHSQLDNTFDLINRFFEAVK
jgi:Ca2+-binding EF-hand superfamily protein